MKKKNKFTMLILSSIMLVFALFSGMVTTTNIEDESTTIKTNTIAVMEYSNRYEVLEGTSPIVEEPNYTNLGGIISVTGVLKNALINIYKDYDPRYTGSYVCKEMFKNFTKLDLSNIIYGSSEEIDFTDFNYLMLPNLLELDLSNNDLSEFDITILPAVKYNSEEEKYEVQLGSPAYTLTTLNLENNKIEGDLDFSVLYEIQNLNLANNKVTGVKLNTSLLKDCKLDYRNNKIESYSNIVLPTIANTTLILFGNPFESTNSFTSNVKVEIGLFNVADKITSATRLKYIEFSILHIETKIYSKNVDKDTEAVSYTEYDYNQNDLTNFEFTLPAGYYKVEHVDKDTDEVLSTKEITVAPPYATYYFKVKGKIYDTYSDKISRGSICFNMDKDGNVINPNIKVYYRYNNYEDWIEGYECDLTKRNGTYGLYYKTVENGVESDQMTVLVRVSYNKYIPDIVIVIIIILVIVFLALVVVPLLKKLLDRISK